MGIFNILSFVVLFTVLFSQTHAEPPARPAVQISDGKLEGIEKVARNGRPYSAFLGIPYGKSNRFEDSVPSDPWNGTNDCSEFGPVCLQGEVVNETVTTEGDEDCLFLNVYTPKATNETQFPVMVWIHGGGFQAGSGQYGRGKYFMSEDVVLVMINYRLGPFGFIDTGHTANIGMKDQILALKWVQQNIHNFGGDPNLVTIFGESAGGWAVGLLLVSPLAKGLFHRAISQSGCGTSPFALATEPMRELRKLAILVDCPISNHEYMVQCIKRVDGVYMLKRLGQAEASMLPEFKESDVPEFRANVDTNVKDPFLPDTPTNLLKEGNFEHVPYINGVNEAEAIGYPSAIGLKNRSMSQKDFNAKVAKALSFDEKDCKGLSAIRDFYVGTENDAEALSESILNMFEDRWLAHPAKTAAVFHAKHAKSYLYYFAKKSPSSGISSDLNTPDSNGLRRAAHADELQYLFDFIEEDKNFPEIPLGDKLAPFSEFMVKLWVSFAKNGTVSPHELSPEAGEWTSLNPSPGLNEDVGWYQLDEKSKMVKESYILPGRMAFWDKVLGM